jgi:hypothetical protein
MSAGQGYGYAVAWCLAQLLQPALLQHVHAALAAQQQPAAPDTGHHLSPVLASNSSSSSSSSSGSSSGGGSSGGSKCCAEVDAGRLLWREFLGQGGSLAHAVELVSWVVFLQEHADVASGKGDAASSSSSSSSSNSVADALRKQGMWPLGRVRVADMQQVNDSDGQEALHPLDVLAVCLGCVLAQIRQTPASS